MAHAPTVTPRGRQGLAQPGRGEGRGAALGERGQRVPPRQVVGPRVPPGVGTGAGGCGRNPERKAGGMGEGPSEMVWKLRRTGSVDFSSGAGAVDHRGARDAQAAPLSTTKERT